MTPRNLVTGGGFCVAQPMSKIRWWKDQYSAKYTTKDKQHSIQLVDTEKGISSRLSMRHEHYYD